MISDEMVAAEESKWLFDLGAGWSGMLETGYLRYGYVVREWKGREGEGRGESVSFD